MNIEGKTPASTDDTQSVETQSFQVDLANCRQVGDYYQLPELLQFSLRIGTTVQTSQGELLVTGAGLRCVRLVAEDIRTGEIPAFHTKNPHPLIRAATVDFEKRLRKTGDVRSLFTRSGPRRT
ncbi:MAG: hypothetical protein AAB383_03225 [Patescibacteria group bacterium]